MSWIKLCVSSWSSTLTCIYGIRQMSNPLTCLWRMSWTRECYLFQCLLGCAWAALGVCTSRSSTDEFLKKEYLVNKNIVHLINHIFWHMPFKNPTHADRVIMLIMFIIHVIMTIILIIRFMVIIRIMVSIHIILIFISGPYRLGPCRSRVAEQACHHCTGGWWVGPSVSSNLARWLA